MQAQITLLSLITNSSSVRTIFFINADKNCLKVADNFLNRFHYFTKTVSKTFSLCTTMSLVSLFLPRGLSYPSKKPYIFKSEFQLFLKMKQQLFENCFLSKNDIMSELLYFLISLRKLSTMQEQSSWGLSRSFHEGANIQTEPLIIKLQKNLNW